MQAGSSGARSPQSKTRLTLSGRSLALSLLSLTAEAGELAREYEKRGGGYEVSSVSALLHALPKRTSPPSRKAPSFCSVVCQSCVYQISSATPRLRREAGRRIAPHSRLLTLVLIHPSPSHRTRETTRTSPSLDHPRRRTRVARRPTSLPAKASQPARANPLARARRKRRAAKRRTTATRRRLTRRIAVTATRRAIQR